MPLSNLRVTWRRRQLSHHRLFIASEMRMGYQCSVSRLKRWRRVLRMHRKPNRVRGLHKRIKVLLRPAAVLELSTGTTWSAYARYFQIPRARNLCIGFSSYWIYQLLDFPVIGFSSYWIYQLLDFPVIGFSSYWTFQLLDFPVIGFSSYWIFQSLDFPVIGFFSYWIFQLLDLPVIGFSSYWI